MTEKSGEFFRKTEHVIPQSFGMFENSPTLNNVVCDDCNQYFGNKLEIIFARDSIEGLLRYAYGFKKVDEYRSMGNRSKTIFRLAEGPYSGAYAYLEYSAEEKKIVAKPLPQVGFSKEPYTNYEFFLLPGIPEKDYLERKGFDFSKPGATLIIQCEDEVIKILKDKGFVLKMEQGEIADQPPEAECEIERTIDNTLLRVIAKISFNYLAYCEGADFVYNNSFNNIRNFILKNEMVDYSLVTFNQEAILEDEKQSLMRREGHIITVGWAIDGVSVVGQVSLFNLLSYKVSLAREFVGVKKQLNRGSFFNVRSGKICEISPGKNN